MSESETLKKGDSGGLEPELLPERRKESSGEGQEPRRQTSSEPEERSSPAALSSVFELYARRDRSKKHVETHAGQSSASIPQGPPSATSGNHVTNNAPATTKAPVVPLPWNSSYEGAAQSTQSWPSWHSQHSYDPRPAPVPPQPAFETTWSPYAAHPPGYQYQSYPQPYPPPPPPIAPSPWKLAWVPDHPPANVKYAAAQHYWTAPNGHYFHPAGTATIVVRPASEVFRPPSTVIPALAVQPERETADVNLQRSSVSPPPGAESEDEEKSARPATKKRRMCNWEGASPPTARKTKSILTTLVLFLLPRLRQIIFNRRQFNAPPGSSYQS